MNTQCEYPFTVAQLKALTAEEGRAILAVADYRTDNIVDMSDEGLSSALNLMKESAGCVPSEEVADDLLATLRHKFAAMYYPAIRLAEAELDRIGFEKGTHFNFCLVVDPSYDNSTHVVIIDYDRPICYVHDCTKAWHVGFENLATLARAVLSTKEVLVKKVQQIRESSSAPLLECRS